MVIYSGDFDKKKGYGKRVRGAWEKQGIKLEFLGDESFVVILKDGSKHTFIAADYKNAGDVVKREYMK